MRTVGASTTPFLQSSDWAHDLRLFQRVVVLPHIAIGSTYGHVIRSLDFQHGKQIFKEYVDTSTVSEEVTPVR